MSKKLQQISVPLISVFLGILLGAIVMWIFGYDAIWGYEELFIQLFGSLRGIGEIFRAMGSSCLDRSWFRSCQSSRFFQRWTSWSSTCRLDSQWLVCLVKPDMPRLVLIPLTVIIALIAGGIVGAIPGILRAYLGTSEVIVTIMMNYIDCMWEMPLFMPFLKILCKVQIQRFVLVPTLHTRHHGYQS